jgi:HK97 family phage major capsid protein
MNEEEKAAVEELKKANADLVQAVTDLKEGKIDQTVVDRISENVVTQLQAANPALAAANPGYKPGDVDEKTIVQGLLGKRGPARIQALVQMPAARAAAVTRIREDDILELQQASDNMAMLGAIFEKQGRDITQSAYYREEWAPLLQAMDTATTAEGIEYVPRELSAQVIERINLQLRVAALFPTIPMPTPTYDVPGMPVARTRLGKHSEQTADTGQTKYTAVTPGTRKITLTAAKFAGRALISRELEEDSILPMLAWLREELVDYIAADLEDCILNGDTTGTHMDSDTTASDDPRKNWNGLRKLIASGFKSDVAAVPTVANTIRVNRKKMGRYGVQPGNLAHICSMSDYLQLLADPSVITMEKYGPLATIVQGELAKVDGSPIIVSEYLRQDLNATGVYDGTTTTKTQLLTVNQRGYLLGERRGVTVRVLQELYDESDQDALTISRRMAFAGRYPTTEGVAANAYDITA